MKPNIDHLREWLINIRRAPLKSAQKLTIIRVFVTPKLAYFLQGPQTSAEQMHNADYADLVIKGKTSYTYIFTVLTSTMYLPRGYGLTETHTLGELEQVAQDNANRIWLTQTPKGWSRKHAVHLHTNNLPTVGIPSNHPEHEKKRGKSTKQWREAVLENLKT